MTQEQYRLDQWNEVMAWIAHQGICAGCGNQMRGGEFAHIIGQTRPNLEWFGFWFIHNSANGRATCSTALGCHCNQKIDRGNTLEGREEHILKVIENMHRIPFIPAHEIKDPLTRKTYYYVP